MSSPRELLERAQALQDAGQAREALAAASSAADGFRAAGDTVALAEALRLVLGGQVQLLQIKGVEALRIAKEEASKVVKSALDHRTAAAMMSLVLAEVYFFLGESAKALRETTSAAEALAQEGEHRYESIALQMSVNAQLLRSNGPKAIVVAQAALSAAQKAGDRRAEAASWLAVATSRHVSGGVDATEAAQRARGLYQDLGSRPCEASALLLLAQIENASGDAQAAQTFARDALLLARETRNSPQTASALEVLVEAMLASGRGQEALEEAQLVLAEVEQHAGGAPASGVAETMVAVLLAHTATTSVDSAVLLAKEYVARLKERGDDRGEARMLHKLSTMSSVPSEAMEFAEAALRLAQRIGDSMLESVVKSTLTDMYAAQGRVEKAPTRRAAMRALDALALALENKDGEQFDDAAKYLDGFYNALTKDDVEVALSRVIAKDPAVYMEFMKEHGQMLSDEKPTALTSCPQIKPVPNEVLYFGFRIGGISYGPRYRINTPAYKTFNWDQTVSVAVVQLADCSDIWERELAYNPSMLDGVLQSTAASGYQL